ncbi:hypothetical protein [Aminobacter sp. Piv2-1]|uniref:hypothetical protein n=1 Tax=Aminobacter sp. Piv2-1 TaxID=3031122 RepID=UPI0030A9ED61
MRPRKRLPRARCASAAAAVVFLLIDRSPVLAHDAPQGWTYPFACCSGYDCREVPKKEIGERPQGYVIERTGEVVGYGDPRIHDSPDGEFHWCSVAGADDTRTICLFVPPRSF